jgi:hypothetical protein
MKREVDNWINRVFDGIDAALRRLQKHCPKCGGDLHRKFSLLDRLGLYVPLPHTVYATHQCDRCHALFRSFRSLTDLFLEAAWVSALLYLGEWRPIALACPITWLAVTYVMKDSGNSGYDTIAAGVLTGVLWLLALVFGNETFRDFFMHHSVIAMPVTVCMLFLPVVIVLVLDRYTTFHLEEC